jgi:hypothetical protein
LFSSPAVAALSSTGFIYVTDVLFGWFPKDAPHAVSMGLSIFAGMFSLEFYRLYFSSKNRSNASGENISKPRYIRIIYLPSIGALVVPLFFYLSNVLFGWFPEDAQRPFSIALVIFAYGVLLELARFFL